MLCSQLKKDLVVYSFKVFLVVRNYSEIWKKVFIIKLEGIEVINQRYYSHKNPIDKTVVLYEIILIQCIKTTGIIIGVQLNYMPCSTWLQVLIGVARKWKTNKKKTDKWT